ncbi:tetratricopeptide repeat protein [Candidatus Leptofilum sp.]|uniref:tetratricopeptide repeat protein n=1 Tax=Candidatus Leptofilum sp. TaxID=3241576 RepID=UPI003B5CA11C
METQPTETTPFEQRIDRLANHLLRAGKGQKSAILFAVYRSEFARAEAEKMLETKLQDAGEKIVRVRVKSEGETVDLPRYLRHHPKKGEAVFFIYDVANGGDATQQYLNYRREFLVEDQQRLLLWLRENEIGSLARNAPDFWAFRGRTLEFLEQLASQHQDQLAGDLAYYNWQGDFSQSKEELEAGIRLREQLLAELPDKPEFNQNRSEVLYALAAQYAMQGRSDKALQLFNQLEQLVEPTKVEFLSRIFVGRGLVYDSLMDYEAALTEYREAIRLNPQNENAYKNRGIVYNTLGHYKEALTDYEEAIYLNPEFVDAYNNRGNTYYNQGNYSAALTNYTEAIRLEPKGAIPYNNRGATYHAQGNYAAALSDYTNAIRLNPEYALAYHNRGITYHTQGNYSAALADSTEAIRLNPEYMDAYNERGNIYHTQRDYTKAYDDYAKANKLNPEDVTAYLNLALLKMDMGKPEKALQHLQRGLELAPNKRQWVANHASFAPLRDDPRFQELVGKGE